MWARFCTSTLNPLLCGRPQAALKASNKILSPPCLCSCLSLAVIGVACPTTVGGTLVSTMFTNRDQEGYLLGFSDTGRRGGQEAGGEEEGAGTQL